jgi:large subunit ribosomal protein L23
MSKDPYTVVRHPYVTEKTMTLMENENKLEFLVDRRCNKREIKFALEKLLDIRIDEVRTFINKEGKHAIIKLNKDYSAEDVGRRIGVF